MVQVDYKVLGKCLFISPTDPVDTEASGLPAFPESPPVVNPHRVAEDVNSAQ